MRPRYLALAFCVFAPIATAQSSPPPSSSLPPPSAADRSGDRRGSITATGQTKPPGSAASGERSDLDRKSEAIDRKIKGGICKGC